MGLNHARKGKTAKNQSNFLTQVTFAWKTMFLQWNTSCWLVVSFQNLETCDLAPLLLGAV